MDPRRNMKQCKGFTLIEISIVILVIGLVAGGTLLGKSLIRSSEIRSVLNEIESFRVGMNNFKQKYNAAPGDMANATEFWGALSAVSDSDCQDVVIPNGTATCNGNGDGMVAKISNWNFLEMATFFQHLSNAEMIEGRYYKLSSGYASIGGCSAGTRKSSPSSRLPGGAYYYIYAESTSINGGGGGPDELITPIYNNIFIFGKCGNPPAGSILQPSEAWGIDNKVDDGIPASGLVRTVKKTSTYSPNCVTSDDATAAYDIANDNISCNMLFVTPLR